MYWSDILKLVSGLLASVGGAGIIISFVVRKCSNYLSDRMLEKYKASLSKDIEETKHELEMETEKFRQKSEQLNFVTQLQFETEFKAYQQIFDCLCVFSNFTKQLFPIYDVVPIDQTERKECFKKRFTEYTQSCQEFSDILEKNAPFIPKSHYELFFSLWRTSYEIACLFPEIRIKDDPRFREDFAKTERENILKTQDFLKQVQECQDTIRDYLSTLKVYTA